MRKLKFSSIKDMYATEDTFPNVIAHFSICHSCQFSKIILEKQAPIIVILIRELCNVMVKFKQNF